MVTLIVGNIGCGKSTVLSALREFGQNVIDCDEINRGLLTGEDYLNRLKKVFPQVFIGGFDKKKLSNLIFSDADARKKLNDIAHPLIEESLLKIVAEAQGDIFIEVPLLNALKSKFYDEIWIVECPLEMQINNIVRRDGITKEAAYNKILVQRQNFDIDIPKKIINNDKELAAVKRQVRELLSERGLI